MHIHPAFSGLSSANRSFLHVCVRVRVGSIKSTVHKSLTDEVRESEIKAQDPSIVMAVKEKYAALRPAWLGRKPPCSA